MKPQLKDLMDFCTKNRLNIDLNIRLGDMRSIEFENESFPFVYSYNTIMHMSKNDIQRAMNEMERVLVKNGLIFVNFGSENSEIGDRGEKIGEGEYALPIGDNETALHSFHTDDEADEYFSNFELLHKEKGMLYSKIETLEQNTIGLAFYPKLGYEEVARQIYYFMKLK